MIKWLNLCGGASYSNHCQEISTWLRLCANTDSVREVRKRQKTWGESVFSLFQGEFEDLKYRKIIFPHYHTALVPLFLKLLWWDFIRMWFIWTVTRSKSDHLQPDRRFPYKGFWCFTSYGGLKDDTSVTLSIGTVALSCFSICEPDLNL